MNRQELFHGDLHLTTVSRIAQGTRGASMIFPFPLVTTMKYVVPHINAKLKQIHHKIAAKKHTWTVTFSHTESYDSIKNY